MINTILTCDREIAKRWSVWLHVWVGIALSLGGCHYTEEDSWQICCNLHIVGDETSSPAARRTIIEWVSKDGFSSQGELNDWVGWDRWPKERISSGYARFSAANWDAQAADYLRTLGMTCRPEQPSAEGKVLCSIELPVWVECTSMNIYFPGGAPVPKELRKPLPARLDLSVAVRWSSILGLSVQIFPIPGGRLCHR